MKKWIRWQGLIAFISICLVMALVWLLVVDWVAQKTIEKLGTQAVGAKVDVAEADVSLFPAGIDVHGLAVTDPDNPMFNAVHINRLHAALEVAPLVRRKFIISDLRVQGLGLNTPRKKSGALPVTKQGKSTTEKDKDAQPSETPWLQKLCVSQDSPQLSIPKIEDIMTRESLRTLKLAEDLRTSVQTAQTNWQTELNQLPDQKALNAYQSRIDKLKKGSSGLSGLLTSASEAKKIHDDLQADLSRIKQAKSRFQAEIKNFKEKAQQLGKAPTQDLQRLKAKYTISADGLSNMSRLLFGQSLCGWEEKARLWYQRIKPLLGKIPKSAEDSNETQPARGKGIDVRFAERIAMPDFLIRQVHLSAELDAGQFTAQAANITAQSHLLGAPLTFKGLGRNMQQMSALNIEGVMDYVQPKKHRNHVEIGVVNYNIQDMKFTGLKDLPMSIATAAANLDLTLNSNGPVIDSLLKASLNAVQFDTEQQQTSDLAQALAGALSDVKQFQLTASVNGTAPDFQTRLSSDLDKVLQQAIGRTVQKISAKFETELRNAIDQKTKAPMAQANEKLNNFGKIETNLTERLKLGDKLLKQIKLP